MYIVFCLRQPSFAASVFLQFLVLCFDVKLHILLELRTLVDRTSISLLCSFRSHGWPNQLCCYLTKHFPLFTTHFLPWPSLTIFLGNNVTFLQITPHFLQMTDIFSMSYEFSFQVQLSFFQVHTSNSNILHSCLDFLHENTNRPHIHTTTHICISSATNARLFHPVLQYFSYFWGRKAELYKWLSNYSAGWMVVVVKKTSAFYNTYMWPQKRNVSKTKSFQTDTKAIQIQDMIMILPVKLSHSVFLKHFQFLLPLRTISIYWLW